MRPPFPPFRPQLSPNADPRLVCVRSPLSPIAGEDRCEDCWAADQQRHAIRRNGTSWRVHNVQTMTCRRG